MKSAGAVLVAKLVSGSLAYDDIWFGGRTRNPWNIEEFSTGSSAGPAASTSAGILLISHCFRCAPMCYPFHLVIVKLKSLFGMTFELGLLILSNNSKVVFHR